MLLNRRTQQKGMEMSVSYSRLWMQALALRLETTIKPVPNRAPTDSDRVTHRKSRKHTAQLPELFWVKVYSCYNFSLGPNVERQIINFPLAPSHFTCASSFKGDYASTRLLLSYTPLQCSYGESFGKELVRSNR